MCLLNLYQYQLLIYNEDVTLPSTCLLLVITKASGHRSPSEIWVGMCPPRPTLGYATGPEQGDVTQVLAVG